MDKFPYVRIRKLCRVMKRVYERVDGVLWWFGHVQRMEINRVVKRVYVGESAGNRSVGRQRKRWIDTMKDC